MINSEVDPKFTTLKEAAWDYKMAVYRALNLWAPDAYQAVLRDPILTTAHDRLIEAVRAVDEDILRELDARNASLVGERLGRLHPRG